MSNTKIIAWIIFFAAGFLGGLVHQVVVPQQDFASIDIVFALLGAFAIFVWYVSDSNFIGYRRTPALNICIVVITVIGLPYYLFRTRGFAKGLLATLVVLLAAIGYSVLSYVGMVLAYVALQS